MKKVDYDNFVEKYLGKTAKITLGGLTFRVKMLEAKRPFGRVICRVSPVEIESEKNSKWVDIRSLKLEK